MVFSLPSHDPVMVVRRFLNFPLIKVFNGEVVVGFHFTVVVLLLPSQLQHFLESLNCLIMVLHQPIDIADLFIDLDLLFILHEVF